MADHNININLKDTSKGAGGRPTAPSTKASDTAGIKKLTAAFDRSLKNVSKDISNSINKTVNELLRKQGARGASGTRKPDINLKPLFSDLANKIVKELSKGVLKKTSSTTSYDKTIERVMKNVDKSVQQLSKNIEGQVKSKYGIKIDRETSKTMADAISSAVRKSIPQSTGKAFRELGDATASVKNSVKEIGNIVRSIKKVRQTGGGIDLTEINKFFKSLKILSAEVVKLPAQFKRLRSTVNEVAKENKELKAEFSNAIKSMRGAVSTQVRGVRERAKEDPREFAKIVAKTLSAEVSKIPSLEGTKIERSLGKLEERITKIGDVEKALKEVASAIKSEFKEMKKSPEVSGALIKAFKNLNTNLGNLPKDLGVAETGRKEFDKLIKSLDNFSQKTGKILNQLEELTSKSTKVNVKIDDKAIGKSINTELSKMVKGIDESFKNLSKNIQTELQKVSALGAISSGYDKDSLTKEYRKLVGAFEKGQIDVVIKQFSGGSDLMKVLKPMEGLLKDFGKQIRQFEDAVLKSLPKGTAAEYTAGKEVATKDVTKLIQAVRKASSSVSTMKDIEKGSKSIVVEQKRLEKNIKEAADVQKEITSKARIETKKPLASKTPLSEIVRPKTESLEYIRGMLKSPAMTRFEPTIVKPSKFGVKPVAGAASTTKVEKSIHKNMTELSKSLDDLQVYIIKTLEDRLDDSWKIVKEAGDTIEDRAKYFTRAGKPGTKGARQWGVQIANIRELTREIESAGIELPADFGTKEIIESYKDVVVKKITESSKASGEDLARGIGEWLKTTSEGVIKTWATAENKLDKRRLAALADIKKEYKGIEVSEEMIKAIKSVFGGLSEEIEEVFKKTYATAEAERGISRKKLVRTVSIPAARLTEEGGLAFETATGSKRALSKFAVLKTGFETLYEKLKAATSEMVAGKFIEPIKKVGIKPTEPTKIREARGLAQRMVTEYGAVDPRFVREQYRKAAIPRGVQLEKAGIESVSEFVNKINEAVDNFGDSGKIKDFINLMEDAGISALDLVKSLDAIKFENVYDVYKKVLEGTDFSKPMEDVAKSPHWDRPIREFEKAVRQVEQMLPLVERGRPRRGMHQENVVNLLLKTSELFAAGKGERLEPDEQKRLIKETNLRLNELMSETRALKGLEGEEIRLLKERLKELPTGVRALSTLGIPETQGARATVLRPNVAAMVNEEFEEGTKYLRALGGVALKMYAENLRELAPFGEFQQWGRNITSVTNAISSSLSEIERMPGAPVARGAVGTEFPTLMTAREREVIESGRYGREGYGFNVLAELRHTAGTFEDQVLVAGKLAKALTSITKTLIRPSAAGRLRGVGTETLPTLRKLGVSDVQLGLLTDIGAKDAEWNIEKRINTVSKAFQEVLGVPEKYKGRADKALIESVEKTISVVRGEDVEVQAAKLAEVFLNYFGRKITTRYGSKGVGITPTGTATGAAEIRDIVERYGDLGISVLPGTGKKFRGEAGLGTAVMPKSMGQLIAEMIDQYREVLEKDYEPGQLEKVKQELIDSGNKFVLDIFKHVAEGLATSSEAVIQQNIFRKATMFFERITGEKLLGDVAGVQQIKKSYKGKVPEGKLFEEKPIDVRISAHGIGKRALQGDVLEAVINNIIGAGQFGQTTLPTQLGPDVYKRLLGGEGERGVLAQYGQALGFQSALQDIPGELKMDELERRKEQLKTTLFKKYSSTEDKKTAEMMAERAASLEALSSFYVDVIDELGKKRKSLVGEKFLSIVEEPHIDKEWTKKQIEKMQKGVGLNLLAFPAYTAIFGKDSPLMKEISSSMESDFKEQLEYIKSLQAGGFGKDIFGLKERIVHKGLRKVGLEELRAFDYPTGTFGPEEEERSFARTVFDIEKFPEAFKLMLPKTTGARGEKEPFYVPGALARGTYPEPLLAGEYGPKLVGRRLQHLVNMAKEVEAIIEREQGIRNQIEDFRKAAEREPIQEARESLLGQASELERGLELKKIGVSGLRKKVRYRLPKIFITRINDAISKAMRSGSEEGFRRILDRLEEIIDKFLVQKKGVAQAPAGFGVGKFVGTPTEHLEKVISDARKRIAGGEGGDIRDAYKRAIYMASDMLVGPRKDIDKLKNIASQGLEMISKGAQAATDPLLMKISKMEEFKVTGFKGAPEPGKETEFLKKKLEKYLFFMKNKKFASTLLGRILDETDTMLELIRELKMTKELGIGQDEEYTRAIEALERAKVDYYDELAKTVLGKSGAVAKTMFARRIPSVMGKAVAVTSDKREELNAFSETLKSIDISKFGLELGVDELSDIAKEIDKIKEEHAENVKKYLKLGYPVLKEFELGIPAGFAKKLPVAFRRRYKETRVGLAEPLMGEAEPKEETLYDLLRYKEMLERTTLPPKARQRFRREDISEFTEARAMLQSEISKHIENELLPYIESVRFPFTGLSTVQPYKPRLLPKVKGGLEKHAFAVPGMPELELEKFQEQIEKVMKVREELFAKRERLYGIEGSDKKIEELTETIDELDRAISNVIPKYIAHQQKLDFDGDTIQIHTAQLEESRKDIKSHFDSFGKDIDSISRVWRDKFTYQPGEGTTTENILTGMMEKFEKKFPAKKGFEFLRKPFLTEELEYLKPAEQLDILAEKKKGIRPALEDVISESISKEEESSKILTMIDEEIKKGNDTSSKLLGSIQNMNDTLYKTVTAGIKGKLFEEKYLDAIEAQLYKIHTGPQVEMINRLQRLFESKIGIEGGQIGGEAGIGTVKEQYAMLHELMRFVQQKGMDVKHAGAKTVANEIVNSLAKGAEETTQLWEKITEEEDYKELLKFTEAVEESIRSRLGRKPTAEIRDVAKGYGLTQPGELSREQLVKYIVEKAGFKGFLSKLQMMISGEIKEYRSKRPKAKDVGLLQIMREKQPLYGLRAFGATTRGQLGAIREKPTVPGEVSKLLGPEYQERYKATAATAIRVRDIFREEVTSEQVKKGFSSYAEMIRTAVGTLYDEQNEIRNILTKYRAGGRRVGVIEGLEVLETKGLDEKEIMKAEKEVSRLTTMAGIPELLDEVRQNIEMNTAASEEFKELAGGVQDEAEQNKILKLLSRKKQALTQVNKVLMAFERDSRANEEILQSLLPVASKLPRRGVVSPEVAADVRRKISEGSQRTREEKKRLLASATGLGDIIGEAARGGGAGVPAGGAGGRGPLYFEPGGAPIPVHIASVAEGIGLTFTTGEVKEHVKSFVDPIKKTSTGFEKLEEEATKAAGFVTKTGDVMKKAATFRSLYRASGISGGGMRGLPRDVSEEDRREAQILSIMRGMRGEKLWEREADPSKRSDLERVLRGTALAGTGRHAQIGARLEKKYPGKVELEKFVKFTHDTAKTVTGHIDAVVSSEEGIAEKIIDVKTVSDKLLKEVGVGKKVRYEDIKGKLGSEAGQKIEDAISQVNFYIRALAEELGKEKGLNIDELLKSLKGEILLINRKSGDLSKWATVEFDYQTERFEKDMEAVAEARNRIIKEGGVFGKTHSIKQLEKAETRARSLTEEEADKFIRKGMAHVRRRLPSKESFITGRKIEDFVGRMNKERLEDIIDKYSLPPDIEPGYDVEALWKNLKVFHQQAKLYQAKARGISFEDMADLPKEIGSLITKAAEEGADYQTFIKAQERFKEAAKEAGEDPGYVIWKAWKLYRIAQADFLIKEAEAAKQRVKTLEEQGRSASAESVESFMEFTRRMSQLQEFMRRNIGGRTDIYTEQKKYIYPGLARAAGVYLSPEQVVRRAEAPLGEEEDLKKMFDYLIKDLQEGKTTVAPIEKIREVFKSLGKFDDELVDIISDSDRFLRMGEEINESWDLNPLIDGTIKLRSALEKYAKFNVLEDFSVVQRKNLENIIKYLKSIENAYSALSPMKMRQEWGEVGIERVPKFLEPRIQEAMHRRNIKRVQKYFTRTEEEGGARRGERFTYQTKIWDQAGNLIRNLATDFHKLGDAVDSTQQPFGMFTQRQRDLYEYTQGLNRGFKAAIMRAVKWGAASRLVYGGAQRIFNMIDTLGDVETAIAGLRMVMSPLETDFMTMQESAIGFAKQYGVPVTEIVRGMRVFGQQGLRQQEVIDRTRTATLASNVTTLNATDATEALTSAMKIYGREGTSTMRFLDAWSEVEAKHAITAGNMADALKKSAAAARNAGVDFDQLNGIVTAIGSVTRQTGKEVGTALRFIFRRLTSEKGPKVLAEIGIPTLTDEGELRKGFDVLNDLSMSWDGLTSAQRMNIAQAVGGTRQYNSLLVLMDNWDEALSAIKDSTNSKGSAERRNLELMKTYQKQLEQTRQAGVELQLAFGKLVLPFAKGALTGIRTLLETISAIPNSIKASVLGVGAFILAVSKGANAVDYLVERFTAGRFVLMDLVKAFKTQFKVGAFEALGIGKGVDVQGLNKIGQGATKVSDLHSAIGKGAFILANYGQKFNSFVSDIIGGAGNMSSKAGKSLVSFEKKLDMIGKGAQAGALFTPGLFDDVAVAFADAMTEPMKYTGKALDFIGEKLGEKARSFAEKWASANTGFIKSVAPVTAAAAVAIPMFRAFGKYYGRITKSAQDYEKSSYAIKRANESELSTIRSLSKEYGRLNTSLQAVERVKTPGVKERQQAAKKYRSPLLLMSDLQKEAIGLTNNLAEQNLGLVAGYDKLGNAVLNTAGSFKEYLSIVEKSKLRDIVTTDIDVLSKYVEDLTQIEGPEKWKYELKKFIEEIPAIGELASKNIKISPAKALSVATERINKYVSEKARRPLTTAFDKDIVGLQKRLKVVREGYQNTYSDFKKLLSELPIEQLGRAEISKILGDERLIEGYKVIAEIEPRFQIKEMKGKVKWQDVLGSEVMKRIFPDVSPLIDASAILTKARLETAGIKPREGKGLSGDIIMFMKDIADKYNIAGNQARLSLKETTDGVFDWFVTYFNTKELKIIERPFTEDMKNMVDQIFPVMAIQEDISERIESLNEFVAGASAGLRGISAKDFRRDFSFGERFFSEIPTTTLVQTTKGFTRAGGFGESPFQKEWTEDFRKYYAVPMRDYRMKLQQLEKLRLEGLEGEVSLGKELYDSLQDLQNVLKNNQAVLQFRAVLVDLTKTFEASARTVKENIAVEKSRLDLEKDVSGYLRDVPQGLDDLNIGVQKFADLTARQRALLEDRGFERTASGFREAGIRREGVRADIYAVDKALVALESIMDVSKGFGSALSPEEMKKYVDVVAKTGDMGMAEIAVETSKVVDNTSTTVDRLDSILENMGDPESIDRMMNSFRDYIGTGVSVSTGKIVNSLERLAKVREKAESKGDKETIAASNKAIDQLSKVLVEKVGLAKATKAIEGNFTLFSKRFKPGELQQRAFGGVNLKTLIGEMVKYAPGIEESSEFKKLVKMQEKDGKTSLVSSKSLIKTSAAVAAFEAFQKSNASNVMTELKKQSEELVKERKVASEQGKDVSKFDEKLGSLSEAISMEQKRLDFHGLIQSTSILSGVTMELSKAFGFSEGQIKALGGTAVGTYAALKILSAIVGQEMPEKAKKFGGSLSEVAKKAIRGEKIGSLETAGVRKAGKEFMREFETLSKEGPAKVKKSIKETMDEYLSGSSEMKKVSKKTEAAPEELVAVARQKEGVSRVRQAIAAIVAAAAAGYIADKGEDKTRLATLRNRAEEQSKTIAELMNKYPEAAQRALDESFRGIDAEKAMKTAGVATEEISKVLDVSKEKDKVAKDMQVMRGRLVDEHEKISNEMGKSADKLARIEIAKKFEMEAEALQKTLDEIDVGIQFEEKMRKIPAYAGKLAEKFIPQPVDFGIKPVTEMAPEESAVYRGRSVRYKPRAGEKATTFFGEATSGIEDLLKDMEGNQKKLEAIREKGLESEIRKRDLERLKERRGFSESEKLEYDALEDTIEDLEDQFESLAEAIERTKDRVKDSIDLEKDYIRDRKFAISELGAAEEARLRNIYNQTAILNKGLGGFAGEAQLPMERADMSAQQRIFQRANDEVKQSMVAFSTQMENIARLTSRVNELQEERRQAFDAGDLNRWKELSRQIKEANRSLDETTSGLREFGVILSAISKLDDALKNLESSILDTTASMNLQASPAMKKYRETVDKLYGGAHPEAIEMITPAEQRKFALTGQYVEPFAPRHDIERARLMSEFMTSQPTGMAYLDQYNAIMDFDRKHARVLESRRKQSETEMFKGGLAPYEAYMESLEKIRIAPGTPEDIKEDILKVQDKIKDQLNKAAEAFYTFGPKAIDKGIGEDTLRHLNEFMKGLQETLPKQDMIDAAAMSDPIVASLETQTDILREIAGSMGVSAEVVAKPRGMTKGFFDELYEKAGWKSGGRIFGEGGPREDRVPAYLSPGEFVIRSAAAQRIGYPALSYMNEKGSVPGFADGTIPHKKAMVPSKAIFDKYRYNRESMDSMLSDINMAKDAGTLVGKDGKIDPVWQKVIDEVESVSKENAELENKLIGFSGGGVIPEWLKKLLEKDKRKGIMGVQGVRGADGGLVRYKINKPNAKLEDLIEHAGGMEKLKERRLELEGYNRLAEESGMSAYDVEKAIKKQIEDSKKPKGPDIFGKAFDAMATWTEGLKGSRLLLADEFANTHMFNPKRLWISRQQAGLAITEIGSRIGQGALYGTSLAEKAAILGLKGSKEKIYEVIDELSKSDKEKLWESVKGSFVESVKGGGTEITAGLLEAGIGLEASKTINVTEMAKKVAGKENIFLKGSKAAESRFLRRQARKEISAIKKKKLEKITPRTAASKKEILEALNYVEKAKKENESLKGINFSSLIFTQAKEGHLELSNVKTIVDELSKFKKLELENVKFVSEELHDPIAVGSYYAAEPGTLGAAHIKISPQLTRQKFSERLFGGKKRLRKLVQHEGAHSADFQLHDLFDYYKTIGKEPSVLLKKYKKLISDIEELKKPFREQINNLLDEGRNYNVIIENIEKTKEFKRDIPRRYSLENFEGFSTAWEEAIFKTGSKSTMGKKMREWHNIRKDPDFVKEWEELSEISKTEEFGAFSRSRTRPERFGFFPSTRVLHDVGEDIYELRRHIGEALDVVPTTRTVPQPIKTQKVSKEFYDEMRYVLEGEKIRKPVTTGRIVDEPGRGISAPESPEDVARHIAEGKITTNEQIEKVLSPEKFHPSLEYLKIKSLPEEMAEARRIQDAKGQIVKVLDEEYGMMLPEKLRAKFAGGGLVSGFADGTWGIDTARAAQMKARLGTKRFSGKAFGELESFIEEFSGKEMKTSPIGKQNVGLLESRISGWQTPESMSGIGTYTFRRKSKEALRSSFVESILGGKLESQDAVSFARNYGKDFQETVNSFNRLKYIRENIDEYVKLELGKSALPYTEKDFNELKKKLLEGTQEYDVNLAKNIVKGHPDLSFKEKIEKYRSGLLKTGKKTYGIDQLLSNTVQLLQKGKVTGKDDLKTASRLAYEMKYGKAALMYGKLRTKEIEDKYGTSDIEWMAGVEKEKGWVDKIWDKIKTLLGFSSPGFFGDDVSKKELDRLKKINEALKPGGSAKVYHHGGVVSKTGPVFAQKGEVIYPKFADGMSVGTKINDVLSDKNIGKTLNGRIEIDSSKFEKAVEKLLDHEFEVEIPEEKIQVEIPDEKIQVELPDDKIVVDVSDAATVLSDTIKDAVSDITINVPTGGVGADDRDVLAEAIKDVNDKIISVKADFEDKISILNAKNSGVLTPELKQDVGKLNTEVVQLRQDVNEQKSYLSNLKRDIVSTQHSIDSANVQVLADINQLKNLSGRGLRGI